MNSIDQPLASPVVFPPPIHVLDGMHNEYLHQAVVQPIGTNHRDATVSGSATTYSWIGNLPSWVNYTPLPVYRFFNRTNGSRFYTSNEAEKERVRTTMTSTYTFEGVGYYLGYQRQR